MAFATARRVRRPYGIALTNCLDARRREDRHPGPDRPEDIAGQHIAGLQPAPAGIEGTGIGDLVCLCGPRRKQGNLLRGDG